MEVILSFEHASRVYYSLKSFGQLPNIGDEVYNDGITYKVTRRVFDPYEQQITLCLE